VSKAYILESRDGLSSNALDRERRRGGRARNATSIVTAAICIVSLLCVIPAFSSEEQPDQGSGLSSLSLEQLGSIEVTSTSKEPEEVWNTPAAIFVITEEDIRRSGVTSVPEALRLAPGVEVARMDSDHWAVGIRGFGSQFSKSVLVLIDGRSVYTPLFAGVYWQLQNVLLEDVERIEIIRGPGGTIWGANAVNGVINIITKNSSETHGGLVSGSGGNVDQGAGNFRYGGKVGKFNYRAYGMAFGRASEFHIDHAPFDDWQMGQGGFRTDWTENRDSFTVQGDLYKGYDGERVEVSSYSPPSVAVVDAEHNVSGSNLLGRWKRDINGNSDLQIQGYYDRTSRLSPQLDETRNTYDIDLIYHLKASRHDLLFGAGGRWSPDHIGQKFATLDFEPHNETDSIYSGFIQDQFSIVPNVLSVVLGSKFEHNNYSGFDVQPNARLLWTPTKHQTIWAALTRAVRTPSRLDTDLQLTDFLSAKPPEFLRVVGAPNFRAEKLVGTEIGYRALLARSLYVDVAAFYNDYNDLYGYGPGKVFVETTPAPAHIVLQLPLANSLKGLTKGIEFAPDWKPASWLDLKGSYSFLHLSVHDKAGFTDALNTASDNGSSPHHEIEFQPQFNLPKKFEFDTTFRYVSALPAQAVGSYQTADARVGWSPKAFLELSFVGQNLFDPHHAEFGGDDGPLVGIRRAYYGKVTWKSE
jgi:iron complex outermembrane receptor protein